MQIAVVGVGGVGGFFGAQLARAGADITFVSRGETGRILRTNGLLVRDRDEEFHVRDIKVVESAAELSRILTVSATSSSILPPQLRVLVRKTT
jgi:2-dehydropantoate 2-reductase